MTIDKDLAEIPSEGDKLEDIQKEEEEKKTPAESPTEENKEDEAPAKEKKETEEKDMPFHEHPRFKSLIEERNKYKEELEKFKGEVDSKFSEIKESQSENTQKPNWFVNAFGDNEEAWEGFNTMTKEMRSEIVKEVKDEQKREQEEKENAANKWNDWIDDQVNSLKDDGLKFDRNELMKVMDDYKPSDNKGNLDFKKGYEIMEILKKKDPEKSKARKELANNDENSKAEPEKKDYKTPEDMRGVGWG